MHARPIFVLLLGLFLLSCAPKETLFNLVDQETPCSIVLELGGYESVQHAHDARNSIDWFDNEVTNDDICRNALAALELQKHLCRILNVPEEHVPIISMNRIPERGNLIFIGAPTNPDFTKLRKRTKRYWDKYPKDADAQVFRVDSFSSTTHQGLVLSGPSSISTLYAVYELLTRWGVRWYSPDGLNDYIPTFDNISVLNMHFSVEPSVKLRGFWMDVARQDTLADSSFVVWMGRNRLNQYCNARGNINALKQRGVFLNTGRQDVFTTLLKPEYQYRYNHPTFLRDDQYPIDPYIESEYYKGDVDEDGKLSYGEAHPEWFGIEKDTSDHAAVSPDFSHICLSHPDAVKEFAQMIVDKLCYGDWKTCDIVDLWMPEIWCTCEKCQTMGNDADKLLYLMYNVNAAIDKARNADELKRRILVHAYAHNSSLTPPSVAVPKDFHTANTAVYLFTGPRCYNHFIIDTKCTDINFWFIKDLLEWLEQKNFYNGDINIAENYNADYFHALPTVHSRVMTIDLPAYAELGVHGVNFQHVRLHHAGVQTLTNYQFARELWDTQISVDTLKAEYFTQYYAGISELMHQYYDRIELAMSTVATWKYYLPRRGFSALNALADSGATTIMINEKFTAEQSENPVNFNQMWENTYHLIFEARYILDQVLMKELPEPMASHIEDLNRHLRYAELLVNVYDNIYSYFTLGHEEEAAREEALIRLVENRDRLADFVIVSPLFGVTNGLESSGVRDLIDELLSTN